MKKTYPMTQQGFDEKQQEHADLQKKRVEAVKELSVARDMGDRSENAAYKSARWKLSGIDRQLRYLKNLLRNATIVQPTTEGVVSIGSEVTVSVNGKSMTYTIVGGHESDLSKGRLSHVSPIGRALLGKREGDAVSISVPVGRVEYTVVRIKN
jgi:transcription elongation factor GreA